MENKMKSLKSINDACFYTVKDGDRHVSLKLHKRLKNTAASSDYHGLSA